MLSKNQCQLKTSSGIGADFLANARCGTSRPSSSKSMYKPDIVYCPGFARLDIMPRALDVIFLYLREIYGSSVSSCTIHFDDKWTYDLYEATLKQQSAHQTFQFTKYFTFVVDGNEVVSKESTVPVTKIHLVFGATTNKIQKLLIQTQEENCNIIVRPFASANLQWIPNFVVNLEGDGDTTNDNSVNELNSITYIKLDYENDVNNRDNAGNLTWQREKLLRRLDEQLVQLVGSLAVNGDNNGTGKCLKLSQVAQCIYETLAIFQATWSESELQIILLSLLSPSRFFLVADVAFTVVLQHFTVLVTQNSLTIVQPSDLDANVTLDLAVFDQRVRALLLNVVPRHVVSLDGFADIFAQWLCADPIHFAFVRQSNKFKNIHYNKHYSNNAIVDAIVCEDARQCENIPCAETGDASCRRTTDLNLFFPLSVQQLCLNSVQNDNDFTLVHWSSGVGSVSTQIVLSDRFYNVGVVPPLFQLSSRPILYS